MEQKKVDKRVLKTRKQLKSGLAKLMEHKNVNQITVKELVEAVEINRSTFYLHFKDIQDLLGVIEDHMESEIRGAILAHQEEIKRGNNFYFIEEIFKALYEEHEIANALLGPNGDPGFISRMEAIIEENSRSVLENMFPGSRENLKYYYSFCLSGCLGLIKIWLESDAHKAPEEMAQMTYRMVSNAKDAFCNAADSLDR